MSYFCGMGRILAVDYGSKRTGIAVTDPLRLIASGLTTLPTREVINFLEDYMRSEEVDVIVVGEPLTLEGAPAHIHHLVVGFVRKLKELFPHLEVVTEDERFTSKEAEEVIRQMVPKKSKRRDKTLVDKVSAALILQAYMDRSR